MIMTLQLSEKEGEEGFSKRTDKIIWDVRI